MCLAGKDEILTDTLSYAHLKEAIDDIPEEKLTAQEHILYEKTPAIKSRLEKIKEETAKYSKPMKFTQCIIKRQLDRKEGKPDEAKRYYRRTINYKLNSR